MRGLSQIVYPKKIPQKGHRANSFNLDIAFPVGMQCLKAFEVLNNLLYVCQPKIWNCVSYIFHHRNKSHGTETWIMACFKIILFRNFQEIIILFRWIDSFALIPCPGVVTFLYTGVDLSTILGGQKVVKCDKCKFISLLLGARTRAAPQSLRLCSFILLIKINV